MWNLKNKFIDKKIRCVVARGRVARGLGEGCQKVQISSYKKISPGEVRYSMAAIDSCMMYSKVAKSILIIRKNNSF